MEQNEGMIDLSKLFQIMGARWKAMVTLVLICTLAALVLAFVLPKQYESTTLVQTRNAGKVDASGAAAAMAILGVGGGTSSPTMNYIELMKTRTVLDPIIDSMDFDDDKKPDAKSFAKQRLDVRNTKGTNLIEVAARGKTPEEAQRISQSVVDNFLLMQTDMNQETQSLLVKFLEKRIAESKQESEEAEERLAKFSKEHKIYSPDDQVKAAIEQLAVFDKAIGEVEVAQKSAQAELDTAEAKLVEQKMESKAYRVSDNAIVQKIRDQIVAKQVEIVGLEERYTEKHPSVQQARNELRQLQGSLDAEVVASVDSNAATLNPAHSEVLKKQALAAVNLAVAEAGERKLKEQREKKESEIGKLPDDVLEYMRLEREVKIKSEVYLNLVKQSEQSKIQEAMESMDIQIVDRANLPDKPVAPRKILIVAMGFVIGVFLAVGYGLLLSRREA
ncbi:GumC family protein [Selenomonas sputigena]|uniref:Chain length determinant protein n=1 Tax=Selenomonas sputigena (strain ATCC 35185 / DSM 20758 / CCUG 44933 / VPI D19B-28) TaxID=546271 RepID=C9LV73_SELS3|nr:GumC family protein [Selenomonas sputigena]AEB99020.1 lipopolysaccharide biosynthesis protein [Selenomonas sputigena ATCC 35185]EEX77195.1 chain length determinant protein [Selenomonas sputigena ATCC 35185]